MAKIMVLDDDVRVAEFCEDILERLGHEVTTAVSRRQFLKSLKDHQFDLIVSDIDMPEMNGFECCQKAIAEQPGIRIVVMTGMANLDSKVEEVLSSQPFHFIRKPFTADAFEAVVAESLVK